MSNEINIKMFDAVGVFRLKDNKGIEELVSQISHGEFLSRSSEYYRQRKVFEFREFRERLKQKLFALDDPQKQFVVAEYMLNCSARVMYNELLSKHKFDMDLCKACAQEDAQNIVNLFDGKPCVEPQHILPKKGDVVNPKVLELDNKALLYAFCKCQNLALDCFVVTPGFGSILLGPFFKVMRGYDYEIVDFSVHKKSIRDFNIMLYPKIVDAIALKKPILLIDDNCVTGRTLSDIKILLSTKGGRVLSGAVQYHWQNYYEQLKHGIDSDRFKLPLINIVTMIAFFGEDFLENAKRCFLKKPSLYVELYDAYGLNRNHNIMSLIDLGEKFAAKAKIDIDNPARPNEEGLNEYSIKLNADLKNIFG